MCREIHIDMDFTANLTNEQIAAIVAEVKDAIEAYTKAEVDAFAEAIEVGSADGAREYARVA